MNVLKKVFAVIFAASLIVGALSACGGDVKNTGATQEYVKDENLNEPGVFPVCKEPITLRVGLPKSTLVTDYVDNSYTKKLEELMNCKIEFEYLPGTDTMQKVELMMTSGGDELPDIICGVNFTDGALVSYGQSGMIVPLNAYYENSAYYLKDVFEAEKDLKELITLPDGNMYYVPKYQKVLSNELGCDRAWINKKWLDKLGLDMPETTDEFKKVLKAFKEQDPNGNGKPDELPFSGYTNVGNLCGLEYLFGSFTKFTPKTSYLYVKDGKVQAGYMQEGWKEAAKYCAELYSEGLISDSTFTVDTNSFAPLKNNPDIPILGTFVAMGMGFSSDVIDRYNDYVSLPPLKGSNGYRSAVWVPGIPSSGLVVTKNCKYPEAAFRLGDLMCSEEMSLSNRWGLKDVDWKYAEEGAVGRFEDMGYKAIVEMINNQWSVPQNAHWYGAGANYRGYALTAGQVATDNNPSEAAIAEATKIYYKYADMTDVKKFVYALEDLEDVNELNTNIEAYVKEMTTAFIIGSRNIDKEWDSYIKELKNMGVDQLIEYTQKAYDMSKK